LNLRELAIEEATLKALAVKVLGRLKTVRADMQAGLDAAEKEIGTRQIAVTLPNGTNVGTISLSSGSSEARITDEAAFKAWVMSTYPTEIERRFITEVRTAFASRLLGEMTAANAAKVIDKETGEIHDVPGVEIKPSRSRTHRLLLKGAKGSEGAAAIEAAWLSGELPIPGVTGPGRLEGGAA
jgi:hypothetical protein